MTIFGPCSPNDQIFFSATNLASMLPDLARLIWKRSTSPELRRCVTPIWLLKDLFNQWLEGWSENLVLHSIQIHPDPSRSIPVCHQILPVQSHSNGHNLHAITKGRSSMTRVIFSWLSPEAKAPSTAPAETKPAESSTIRVVIRRFLSWALEMGHGHNVFIRKKWTW